MKRAKFENLMDQTGELPTLPAVAHKVLELVNREDSDARSLQAVIEHDPVLSARILRLANSAYYKVAGSEDVSDMCRAIVVLGFMTIRNVAVTTCLRSLYSAEFRTNHFSAVDLWKHSAGVAVISRMLARKVAPAEAEEAFLAGIIHDVGMIVEWNVLPDRFPLALRRFHGTGMDFRRAEKDALGFDHTEAGASVLRKWKFPARLRKVVAHHHCLKKVQRDDVLLPSLVHVAEKICADRGNGFFDHSNDDVETSAILQAMGLEGENYRDIMDEAEEELHEAREILNL